MDAGALSRQVVATVPAAAGWAATPSGWPRGPPLGERARHDAAGHRVLVLAGHPPASRSPVAAR